MIPIALTIAGSDPSGGAGIQADLKTFHQLQIYGTAAIALITVQNTKRVSRVENLPPDLIRQQIEAVLEDLPPLAAKTGALGTAASIRAVAGIAWPCPLIVDPVMIGKHGARLLDYDAVDALRSELLPRAALVTPNLDEAAVLTGIPVKTTDDMKRAAALITGLGAKAVLIKGGHLEGDAVDVLWHDKAITEFRAPRLKSRHTHGTGCTLSAAITAYVARGLYLKDAVARAKAYLTHAIQTAPGIGGGSGPVNHWAKPPIRYNRLSR